MKNDIFISHAFEDADAAEAIAAALERAGLRCFIASRDSPPGAERAAAIIDAICETRLFLLLCSRHASHSLQVAREIQLVHDRHIPVFPVRLDESPPDPGIAFFLKRQSVFAAPPPLERHLRGLVDAVVARLGPPAHRRPA